MMLSRLCAPQSHAEDSDAIRAPQDNVTGLGNWQHWIVQMNNEPARNIDVSDILDRVRQVWLTGYYVQNASVPDLRIEVETSNFDVRDTIINGARGGHAIFIEEPVLAAGQRIHLDTPQPLLGPHASTNRLAQFRFRVTDWNGAAVTFARLTLHFALQVAEPEQSTTSNAMLLPFSAMYRQGADAF